MTVKQRKYVDGFKEQALTKVFARSGDQTVRSIAADVGMNIGTLRGWMKVALREQKHPSASALPSALARRNGICTVLAPTQAVDRRGIPRFRPG
jgi:hypothetical protein